MTIERWRNSETGEIYEVEYGDGSVVPIEKARRTRRPKVAPAESTPEPITAPEAVLAAREASPSRYRLIARRLRAVLEDPDDAA